MTQHYKNPSLTREEGKAYLDKYWSEIKNKVLPSLWKKYRHKYQSVGLELGDFEGIAYIILEREVHKYNPNQSKFCTFAQMVVSNRMYSYIRNVSERDKTRLSVYHESLEAPISKDENVSLGDIIPDDNEEDNTDCKKIHQFLSKTSRVQEDIIIYHLLGISQDEIVSDGGISERQYRFAMSSMKMPETVSMFNLKGRLK